MAAANRAVALLDFIENVVVAPLDFIENDRLTHCSAHRHREIKWMAENDRQHAVQWPSIE